MIQFIKTIFLFSIFLLSKIAYLLTKPFINRKNAALILAPSWEGSKGDEAVISASSSELKSRGFRITLIHFGKEKEWEKLTTIDNWYGIPDYFPSGGWRDHFKFIILFAKNSRFYLLGTDMLDGSYGEWLTLGLLKISHQAAFSGLKTNIVSISINTWQNQTCIKAMAHLPRRVKIGVRDEISFHRLSGLIPNREISQTSDIAFILKPRLLSPEAQNYFNWVKLQKDKGRIIFGININPVSFDDKREAELFIEIFSLAIIKLTRENPTTAFSFLLIPHDFRHNRNDYEFLKMLYEKLPSGFYDNTLIMEKQITSEEIKAVVSGVDIAISSRMHLAVALLSQAIPIACIIYQPVKKGQAGGYSDEIISSIHQDKFDGLFSHFQLSGLTLTPEKCLVPGELFSFIGFLYKNRVDLQNKLKYYLPDVINKAILNLN